MTITVIRSDRQTLALEVTREGQVIVRSPRRCPGEDIDKFVSSHSDWLQKALARQESRRENYPEPTAEEQAELTELARRIFPQKLAHWAKIMGLSPAGLTITGARTRFGSCSGKNRISLSWRLMQYPEAAIDYVVVHELAHILEKNHSPRFYAIVEKYLPDYKARQRLLKGY